MSDLKPWSELKVGRGGELYGVRYLLTVEEVASLQIAGLIGEVSEIVGMQAVVDAMTAQFERDALLSDGGRIQ